MRRLSSILALMMAFTSCVSSTPRTQIMVIVDAQPGVLAADRYIRIQIWDNDGTTRVDQTFIPGETGPELPFTTSIVPLENDPTRKFTVVVTSQTGVQATGDTPPQLRIARLRAVSGFVPRRTLALPLRLDDACIGVPCGDEQTCRAGRCEMPDVDTSMLPDFRDPVPSSDAGSRIDASDAAFRDAATSDASTSDAGAVDAGALAVQVIADGFGEGVTALPAGADVVLMGWFQSARVLQANGWPLEGAEVQFAGNALASPVTLSTNADGTAQPWSLILVCEAGVQRTLEVRVGGEPRWSRTILLDDRATIRELVPAPLAYLTGQTIIRGQLARACVGVAEEYVMVTANACIGECDPLPSFMLGTPFDYYQAVTDSNGYFSAGPLYLPASYQQFRLTLEFEPDSIGERYYVGAVAE